MKRLRWVISKSGIRHIVKGLNYNCNEAIRHTGDYDTYNIHPTCSKCSMFKQKLMDKNLI